MSRSSSAIGGGAEKPFEKGHSRKAIRHATDNCQRISGSVGQPRPDKLRPAEAMATAMRYGCKIKRASTRGTAEAATRCDSSSSSTARRAEMRHRPAAAETSGQGGHIGAEPGAARSAAMPPSPPLGTRVALLLRASWAGRWADCGAIAARTFNYTHCT
jgi:hypothetical protein